MTEIVTENSEQIEETPAVEQPEHPQIIINTGTNAKGKKRKRPAPKSMGTLTADDKRLKAELAKYNTDFYSWQEAFIEILDKYPDLEYQNYKILVETNKNGRKMRGDNYPFLEFMEMCNSASLLPDELLLATKKTGQYTISIRKKMDVVGSSPTLTLDIDQPAEPAKTDVLANIRKLTNSAPKSGGIANAPPGNQGMNWENLTSGLVGLATALLPVFSASFNGNRDLIMQIMKQNEERRREENERLADRLDSSTDIITQMKEMEKLKADLLDSARESKMPPVALNGKGPNQPKSTMDYVSEWVDKLAPAIVNGMGPSPNQSLAGQMQNIPAPIPEEMPYPPSEPLQSPLPDEPAEPTPPNPEVLMQLLRNRIEIGLQAETNALEVLTLVKDYLIAGQENECLDMIEELEQADFDLKEALIILLDTYNGNAEYKAKILHMADNFIPYLYLQCEHELESLKNARNSDSSTATPSESLDEGERAEI